MVTGTLEIRPKFAKWEVFCRPTTMRLSSISIALIGAVALILIPFATASFSSAPTSVKKEAVVLPKEDALDLYLSRLVWAYECTGACAKAERKQEPYRRIDSNGAYSYGCLQFQQSTYLMVAKKYGIDPWQGRGIYDCGNQWALARLMFLEDPVAASGHWYTSIHVRGLGLPHLK